MTTCGEQNRSLGDAYVPQVLPGTGDKLPIIT
jgi:hypothetical protein